MSYTFSSKSEDETRHLGSALADQLKSGMVIGLSGTLGSGKTALTRAIAAGLNVDQSSVTSPTFALCVPYQGRLSVLHVDAYRINHLEELDELGLDEQVEQGAVLIVEWVERIREGLPDLDLLITATPAGETHRVFEFEGLSKGGNAIVQFLTEWTDAN